MQPTVTPPIPTTVTAPTPQPSTPVPSEADVYATICSQIISEQARIIGTLSYEQASRVSGLSVDPQTYACVITGQPSQVLENLVEAYREFFGNAAVEVCRDAASKFTSRLPSEQLPAVLRG